MNSFLLKIIAGSLFFISLSTVCIAKVYVYEVATNNRRFQTVSKLNPKSYLYYNGGKDIIKKLTVVAVYADDKLKEAMRDYKLEKANANKLLPRSYPDQPVRSRPFIWWK